MPHTDVLARTATAVALCLAGLAVSACSTGAQSEEEAPSGTDVSASSGGESSPDQSMSGGYAVGPDGKLLKPSTGPDPILPDTPASITENTPDAAERFARYFVAVTEYAWNSGDTTRLREISTEDCELCNSMTTSIESGYENGEWVQGLKYRVSQTDRPVPFPHESDKYAVLIHVRS